MPPADVSACPAEDQLLALVRTGSISPEREQLLGHLDVCDSCRQLTAEAARSAQLRKARPPGSGACSLAVGERVVGRYEIRRFIARGGMGEVYEAHDLLLDERVALKTLASTALDDDRAAFRFRAEARLARRVTHANVCRILEFGVQTERAAGDRESLPFLTMEFLQGETLAGRLARGPLPPRETARVAREVLVGLKAIHDAGIIHRDLKSENVFLVPDPRGERVVLMDFGLARALDGSVVSTLPKHSFVGGTLDCMAPEQLEGGPVDKAADVYAFGVLLFELMVGRRPFIGVAPSERLAQPPPSPLALAPQVDRRWSAIAARCLARRPADRFAGIDTLLAALPATMRARRGGGPGARHRMRALGFAVLALAALVATGATLLAHHLAR